MSDDFRTPLAKVRGAGSAKEGTGHFIGQRISAIFLALLAPYLVISAALSLDDTYASAREWVSSVWVAPALALALFTALYHMQLGMQVIIEDYVHSDLKLTLIMCNTFFCFVIGLSCIYALVKLSFGV